MQLQVLRACIRCLLSRPSGDIQLMTYRSYLDSFAHPFRGGRGPDAEAYNSEAKAQRQAKKRKFTEPGEPGHMFRCAALLMGVVCTLWCSLHARTSMHPVVGVACSL